MRQFEVHPNPAARSRASFPYVVVLRSHLLAASHATIVAPMLPQDGRSAFTEISVTVRFRDSDHIVLVGEMAPLDTRLLTRAIGDLGDYEYEFRRALDRLFTGF
ncbi:CcdB family protein [Phenylobacterium sp.]|uniref:Toxin CcdB n=1 Tax=Phenylobacterium ferrooxidans TaxID=2982689 RepID=A0ABW6CX56_9CAUL|nr:CcdB family protein [Phenylobacterium sp.]MDO8321573.1 CcdB family protein [Phenylobacterium sp.]MDP3632404.1 CcdB family protein [Phenylobacterium sp.]MDP3870724.1 CcdB family protein [Phenylobacterium sp.]